MSKLGMVLGVVGIVLTLVGFAGPWWTINISASFGGQTATSSADFRLFGGTATATAPGFSQTNTTDYSSDPNTRSVFLVGAALSALAVALGVLMVVFGAMVAKKPSSRRITSLFGVLAFAAGLVAVLYVMGSLPAAVNQDSEGAGGFSQISGFWGTSSTTFFGASATVNWAAGWAWYVVFVGAIIFLIGGVLAMRAPKAAPMAPTPEAPPEAPPRT